MHNPVEKSALVVLVVEDEFLVRSDIANYLRDAGCIVIEADSVEGALVLCGEQAIHVLVTDIQLNGGGSGWDLAEKLRARYAQLGVIYTSGNHVDKSRSVAGSRFFGKPYRGEDILQACRQAKS